MAIDVGATLVPIIPGGAATALKIGRVANRGIDAANLVDNTIDGLNAVDNVVDAAKQADTLSDVSKVDPCLLKNSFSAETVVWTANGLEPIWQVDEGEWVYAWHEASNTIDLYPVTAEISHLDAVIVTLWIAGERLYTTLDHPFWVEGAGWVDHYFPHRRQPGSIEEVSPELFTLHRVAVSVSKAWTSSSRRLSTSAIMAVG